MNMLFNTKDVIKRRRRDRKIYKAMIIPVGIHEINKFHCYSSTKECM